MDAHFILSLFHILFVVPLFLGVGFIRSNTPQWLYLMLLILGFVILVYHGFKLFLRLKTRSNYAWVNAIHVLFVAPLLIYIGYNKKETPRAAYELMLMTGFAAGGYHLYSLVNQLQAHPEPKK
jgi:hypothetical protein